MKAGYKLYNTYTGIKLNKNGFNSYDTKKSCQLGKLIEQVKKELNGRFIVWYEVTNEQAGNVNIIYKDIKSLN